MTSTVQKYGTLGRRLWQPWNLRKYVYWKGKNIMLVVTEVNNLGGGQEGASKSLVYCAFPNVWLYLANLGQSLFFFYYYYLCVSRRSLACSFTGLTLSQRSASKPHINYFFLRKCSSGDLIKVLSWLEREKTCVPSSYRLQAADDF